MPTQVGVPQGFNSPDLLASQNRAMLACFLADTEMIVKLNNKYLKQLSTTSPGSGNPTASKLWRRYSLCTGVELRTPIFP